MGRMTVGEGRRRGGGGARMYSGEGRLREMGGQRDNRVDGCVLPAHNGIRNTASSGLRSWTFCIQLQEPAHQTEAVHVKTETIIIKVGDKLRDIVGCYGFITCLGSRLCFTAWLSPDPK